MYIKLLYERVLIARWHLDFFRAIVYGELKRTPREWKKNAFLWWNVFPKHLFTYIFLSWSLALSSNRILNRINWNILAANYSYLYIRILKKFSRGMMEFPRWNHNDFSLMQVFPAIFPWHNERLSMINYLPTMEHLSKVGNSFSFLRERTPLSPFHGAIVFRWGNSFFLFSPPLRHFFRWCNFVSRRNVSPR